MIKSKAVFITGISGGIGQSLCSVFRQNGWVIVGSDIICPEIEPDYFLTLDLSKISQKKQQNRLKNFIDEVKKNVGIAALINNAAIQITGTFNELGTNSLSKTLEININAPFIITKMLFEHLSKHNGRIINIGSIHSKQTKKGFLPYAVSKAGLLGLTRSLSLELGHAISVNSIEPAAIDTQMLMKGFNNNEAILSQLKKFHPTGSIGCPYEVAELAYYLIESAPKFLNGSSIMLDGGINNLLKDPQ
jgi:NAD(P)-dependent dehydrogenase (short-subunit alcohol dehydrogenase family)